MFDFIYEKHPELIPKDIDETFEEYGYKKES
jgi:hypothetical protein